jgi:MSHA pilin protein MshC
VNRVSIQRGFTLTELITVLVIVGILAAIVAPRFFEQNVFVARGTRDQILSTLRFAQKMAISQHRNISAVFTSATTLNCASVLTGTDIHCTILNSVAITPALPQTYTFNALGQRVPNSAVTITVGNSMLTIEAETGYVH